MTVMTEREQNKEPTGTNGSGTKTCINRAEMAIIEITCSRSGGTSFGHAFIVQSYRYSIVKSVWTSIHPGEIPAKLLVYFIHKVKASCEYIKITQAQASAAAIVARRHTGNNALSMVNSWYG